MEIVFIVISIVIILVSRKVYKKIINPCSIYALIWIIDVLLYCMNGFQYEELSIKTLIVMCLFEISLCTGIMIGEKYSFKWGKGKHTTSLSIDYEAVGAQIIIDKFIIISLLISSVSIISALISILSTYGISNILLFINNVSQIYQGRATGEINYGIAIFSSMIYVTLILVSFQITRGRFKIFYIIPVFMSFINAVNYGGRNAAFYTIICIAMPFILGKYRQNVVISDLNNHARNKRVKRKTISVICIFILLAIGIFTMINSQRAQTSRAFYHRNASTVGWLDNLIELDTGFLTLYLYSTGPLSYLNHYLENPFYSFGANTFYPIYRQLDKLGFDVQQMIALDFGTQSVNVGTYITELIIDFGLIGGLLFIFLFGVCFGNFHRRTIRNDLKACLFTTLLYICILLSFFMWYLRTPVIWLAGLYGAIIISMLNKLLIKKGYILHVAG